MERIGEKEERARVRSGPIGSVGFAGIGQSVLNDATQPKDPPSSEAAFYF